eukprot:13868401-Alexandrium_andersonii.AAC.1
MALVPVNGGEPTTRAWCAAAAIRKWGDRCVSGAEEIAPLGPPVTLYLPGGRGVPEVWVLLGLTLRLRVARGVSPTSPAAWLWSRRGDPVAVQVLAQDGADSAA